ncbi:MAG: NTP transferase domain-containing protein [Acidimicrobiia bacterium]|jgi:choline kinase
MTSAIVLAAGLGRRLAGATTLPKWLAPVDGVRPADPQLQAFEAARLARVHVVVSPDPSAIVAHLEPWAGRLDLRLVPNPHAATRNNWYSLLLGLRRAAGDADDLVVANSDLFASSAWFIELIDALRRSGAPAALAVDPSKGKTDEAMKVALAEGAELVSAIGKVGVAAPAGEYVGLAWWSAEAAAELAEVLSGFEDDPSRADHWYEHGIQCHIEGGGRYQAVQVPSDRWIEIDDEADLAAARALRTAVAP